MVGPAQEDNGTHEAGDMTGSNARCKDRTHALNFKRSRANTALVAPDISVLTLGGEAGIA